jgi:zinc-binding in reverse transcriptase
MNLTTTKIFTVKSAYKFLNNPEIPNPTLNNIWHIRLPPKIKIFIWLVLQDKLQSAQNLQRKGWPAITDCIMCNTGAQETTEHLFISCPTAASLAGPTSTQARTSTLTILEVWCEAYRTSQQSQWAASAWTIWKERNRHIFQGEVKNLHAMKIEQASYNAQWERCTGGRNNSS